MAKVLDWKESEDKRDIVHIIVQALVEGNLVALPAETAYHVFASALKPEAVEALVGLAQSQNSRTPSLFLRSPQEAHDYSPHMSKVANRGVNRGWPGPLVLELPVDSSDSLAQQLPPTVYEQLVVEGKYLAQRVGAHEAILQAMRLMPGPLVAAPIVQDDEAVCNGDVARRAVEDEVALIVNDGDTHYGGFATTVRVEENQCSLIVRGVLDDATLDQLFQFVVLLVCTGNTCRSPMAEVLLRSLLEKRFPQIASENGSQRALSLVASAGLSAFPGGPASKEAQNVVKKRGLSLNSHQSSLVTERSLRYADHVLTMTHSHRAAIVDRIPELENKVQLLSGSSEDVSDPFGGSEPIYAACADQIEGYLERWVAHVEESWFPSWQNLVS